MTLTDYAEKVGDVLYGAALGIGLVGANAMAKNTWPEPEALLAGSVVFLVAALAVKVATMWKGRQTGGEPA